MWGGESPVGARGRVVDKARSQRRLNAYSVATERKPWVKFSFLLGK